jgi:RND superfamily putative drug exporter
VGLFAVLLGCLLLGVVGLGVEGKLAPLSLEVPGTSAAEGESLAQSNFGDSSPFVVLVRGPAAAVDRQGVELVRSLRRQPEATVISPWDRGSLPALRPSPHKALVLVDYHVPLSEAMRDTVPELERVLAQRIRPPVVATQSGFASVSRALQEESLSATERAELLAAPLLVLVLLLVFRSVTAAAVPLAFGALTVFAGRGVLALLSSVMTIDALSLVVCTMMGLALGVDYSLLIVSRFREELDDGREPWAAASAARASAGRTTAFAGATLIVALLGSALLQPGSLLLSLATATGVVTLISIVVSVFAVPPLLALLGERINAGRIGRRRPGSPPVTVAGAAAAALRKPAVAAGLVAVPLVLLILPTLAFTTGAPGIDELPSSNPARASAETIDRAVGPGWEAPFVLVAATESGPITTRDHLAQLARWQRRIAAEPGVRAVIGPGPIARRAAPLRSLGSKLASEQGAGPSQLGRLGPGLRRAARAVEQLRGGIAEGAEGSGLLAEGSERAAAGAGLIASELGRAAVRGEAASGAIERLRDGSRRLADGQRKTAVGSLTLALGLRSLLPRVRGGELARARKLAHQLERAAASDPSLAPAADQARVLARTIALNRDEVRRLRAVAQDVNGGLNRLVPGGRRLEAGVDELSQAANGLSDGLQRLGDGAERLSGGLIQLQGGAGALQAGLSEGFHRSYPLQADLRRAGVRVSAVAAPLEVGARRLQEESPHLFDSGYFVLSALDGAPAQRRAEAGEAVSVDSGGQAARLLVVSTHPFNSEGSRRTGERLLADADGLAAEGGLRTGLTGGAATLNTYGEATLARLPLVIGAFILFTLLALVFILRAPLLALLAVCLNLASVAAAIGVMTLVCQIPAGYPLGGHPYVDTVGAGAIFGVTFGLSIDYAVFLIARMRERYEVDGDNRAAVAFGLEKTAGVITGAAAIMAAVFISFATAPIATVSQMGVGLTVAILLDATVVRIVLLPALMLMIGDRVWHVPPALDRILPGRNLLMSETRTSSDSNRDVPGGGTACRRDRACRGSADPRRIRRTPGAGLRARRHRHPAGDEGGAGGCPSRTADGRREEVRQGDLDLRLDGEADRRRPSPDRRRGPPRQVVRLPETAGVLPGADHRPAAPGACDQGAATDLALHPQRQSRQQRRARLRVQLLQLQVLEVRVIWPLTGRAFRAASSTLLLAAGLAAIGSGQAHGERAQHGNLILSLDGGLSPLALPRDRPAPVSLRLAGGLQTTDGTPVPRVTRVELGLPGQGLLDVHGLAVCQPRLLRNATPAGAIRTCGDALVGHGEIEAEIRLPNQRPFDIDAKLEAFNSRIDGRKAVILHAFSPNPPSVIVLPFVLRLHPGRFRTRLIADLPPSLGPWPHFTHFEVHLFRRYRYRGRTRSYISASCPIPKSNTAGFFSLAQASFLLDDGRQIGTGIARSCRAR